MSIDQYPDDTGEGFQPLDEPIDEERVSESSDPEPAASNIPDASSREVSADLTRQEDPLDDFNEDDFDDDFDDDFEEETEEDPIEESFDINLEDKSDDDFSEEDNN